MSVLIKGYIMPESCKHCTFLTEYDKHTTIDQCRLTGIIIHETSERSESCPLIEVSPNGDLIDRDEYLIFSYTGTEGRQDTFDDGVMFMIDRIDDAPTIIPAEKGY